MISPLWFRPAVGQLLRGGIDYRSYLSQIALLGLFVKREGDLGWLHGILKTWPMSHVSEEVLSASGVSVLLESHPRLCVDFHQPIYNFTVLNGWHEFLLSELRAITRPALLEFVDGMEAPWIGINIRCGNDFKPPPLDSDYSRIGWLQKTPLSWFVETLRVIRERAGWNVPALVVSDGTDEILEAILKLENVTFLRPGNAITDMLMLARSKILLASASSTFSGWACFLGQMPTITAPGHPMTEWGIQAKNCQLISEFKPQDPNEEFLSDLTLVFDQTGFSGTMSTQSDESI